MPTKKIGEKITNLSQLQIEDGIIYDEEGIALPVPVGSIYFNQLPNFAPPATANTTNTATLFDGMSLLPMVVEYGVEGTFATDETLTVTLRATYTSGTIKTISLSEDITTAGDIRSVTYWREVLTDATLADLLNVGGHNYLKKLEILVSSNIDNSEAVLTNVKLIGFGK